MNRLAHESSPYLLQHKDNPVDWYPWGAAALDRARAEDKPIFLSIGYSACHWCHVMEHESFEDTRIAELLNRHFICIKVDREERPDLDHIYMQAVQMMTGRGGWPLSAFLTPAFQPFYGGTYWPPVARGGMPGFGDVLNAVVEAWRERREAATEQAARLTDALRPSLLTARDATKISLELLTRAQSRLTAAFDPVHGGFGRAPKFPRTMELQLLLRVWQRGGEAATLDMVCLTLDKMAAGGMYDHLAGGFARYSVDDQWLVPHFEKMLYDNALLTEAYLDGFLATGNERYATIVQETLDYILRDMTDAQGAFHSTEDADSEGEEGKYYVWTVDEIQQLLGEAAARRFAEVYGVTRGGNFEGQSILHLAEPVEEVAARNNWDLDALNAELAQSRSRLLEHRQQRVRPGKDDKVLVSWNGLMIHAFARAASVCRRDDYLAAARRAARFVLTHLRREDGRLLHSWRHGTAKLDAYLDDYSCLANALVTLYESDFDERWLDEAAALCDTILRHFADPAEGGFFFTADDHEQLVVRTKEWTDASVPASNAMAATVLLRLGKLTGRGDLWEAGQQTLAAAASSMAAMPEAFGQMLLAVDLTLGPSWELALVIPQDHPHLNGPLQTLREAFLPRRVLACRSDRTGGYRSPLLDALFAGKSALRDEPTLYVCEGFSCREPLAGPAAIQAWVAQQSRAAPSTSDGAS